MPVLVYLKKRAASNQQIVIYTFVLWFLWYLPYAPFHEGCHFVGSSLAGMRLKSHQFTPPVLEGRFHPRLSHLGAWRAVADAVHEPGPLAVHVGAWIVMLLGMSSAVREIAPNKSG